MRRFSASLAIATICVAAQTGAASALTSPGDVGPKQDPAAGRYYRSVMEKSPAMYWRLDEASGTTVHDASGNNRTGTITGTVAYQQEAGGTWDSGDKAISLDGSTAYVRADSYAPFASYSRRTFVLLLKWDSSQPGVRNIFGGSGTLVTGVSDDMRFPVVEINSDVFARPVLVWFHSIARQFPVGDVWSKEPNVGRWMQIVLTVDDSASTIEHGVKLWINGDLVGSPSGPWVSPFDAEADRFMFGTRFNNSGNLEPEFIDGTYDEVAIYDRILSDGEIRDLAAAAGPPLTVNLSGSGTGSVTGPGISCPGDCTETYARGTSVTLNAAGTGGSTFARWGGACSGTGPCVLTMDADKGVTASFNLPPTPTPTPPQAAAPPACKGIPATIVGTEGNDVRKGTSGRDVIVGLAGNDKLSGLAGKDLICGGPGKDTLKGGKGNDKLYGRSGMDTLKGGPGKDKLKGGAGKDKQVQ